VVELRDYRAAVRKVVAVDAEAQEGIVEETQSSEAVTEGPSVGVPGERPPAGVLGEQAAPPSDTEERDPLAMVPVAEPEVADESIEARDSDHGEDGGDRDGGDGGDGGDEPGPGDSAEGEEAVAGGPAGDSEGEAGNRAVEGERLDSILESLLLAAGSPLTVRRMCDAIRSGPKAKEVRAALGRLKERYSGDCGVHLLEVAGGYQFRTAAVNAKFVRNLLREKPARLGRAALETLSIIAYKQPATRGDIEAIRGVDADSAVNTLLSKRLIKVDGRRETVGRPLLYSTTPEFLEVFGLKDLKELPTLKEIGPVAEPENEQDIEEEDFPAAEIAEAIVDAAAEAEARGEAVEFDRPSSEEGDQRNGEEAHQPSSEELDGHSDADAEAISGEGAGRFQASPEGSDDGSDDGEADDLELAGQDDGSQDDGSQDDGSQDDDSQDDDFDCAVEEDGGGAAAVAVDGGAADAEGDAEASGQASDDGEEVDR